MTDKRTQIIEAAIAEFRELGFASASVDRIAERARVSKRTIYNHFESKNTLFRAIMDQMYAQVGVALAVAYEPTRPVREQFVALGWTEGRLLTSPSFMALASMVVSEMIRDPALASEFSRKTEHIDAFRRFIEDAAAAGALKLDDAGRAADQFLGLLKSQAFWPAVISGEIISEAEMGEIIEDAVDLFLARYG